MSGAWLVSYLALWVVVVVLGIFVIGILQQLGVVTERLAQVQGDPGTRSEVPTVEHDGPELGSPLPALRQDTVNGFGVIDVLEPHPQGTLIVSLSTVCESCQRLVEPLNAAVEKGEFGGRLVVVLRGDCRAFLSVFPVQAPVVCDDRGITRELNVHNNPFGLLYNAHGVLTRKGILAREAALRHLLGDDPIADTDLYPPLVVPGKLEPVQQ